MVYSREEFLKNNPDKKMISLSYRFEHGYGSSKYRAEWSGEWTLEELVNYADDSTGNFGGRIENLRETEDGTHKGTIVVYYD